MREPWATRKFAFDFPVERIAEIISRLRGTIFRIDASTRGRSPESLAARPGDRWSVHEHVGHLWELDGLHLRRLHELSDGATQFSAADMSNQATWDAAFHEREWHDVLGMFRKRRVELLFKLEQLDESALARTARHPRLDTPMRAVDVAFFAAEHDDNHIASIEQILSEPDERCTATATPWAELPLDAPMPKLERRRIVGSEAMISHITLHAGCDVPIHAHANEQFAVVLSGKVKFTLSHGNERVLGEGEVLHLPPFAAHGAYAIETAVVLDVFSPPSETTGIDTNN